MTFTVPAAMTVTAQFQNAQDVSAVAARQVAGVAGQTGTRTITASSSADWVAQAMVLRAA